LIIIDHKVSEYIWAHPVPFIVSYLMDHLRLLDEAHADVITALVGYNKQSTDISRRCSIWWVI